MTDISTDETHRLLAYMLDCRLDSEVSADVWRDLTLEQLGIVHRELAQVLEEVRDALEPAIQAGSARGMTYLELASAAGYGSLRTIVKIMKSAPVRPSRGPR